MPKSAYEINTPIKSGNDFIQSIKNETDSESTFIESGSKGEIYWACTSNEAFDGPSGSIVWYPRAFLNNGNILVLYSRKSCKDSFVQAMEIVKSMRAK
jgi:hypothetical protein